MHEYDIGDMVTLRATFSRNKLPRDPDTVLLLVRRPDGETIVFHYGENAELERDGEGEYHADVEMTAAGVWRYRYAGTGAVHAAAERTFKVRRSGFIE